MVKNIFLSGCKDPIVKHKAIKLLEGNIGKNVDDLGNGDDFLDTPKAQFVKETIDRLDFIKIKNCLCKTMLGGWEFKPQTGRKYLLKTHLVKDSYLKYRKLLNFNSKKTNSLIKKWAKTWIDTSLKKIYQ